MTEPKKQKARVNPKTKAEADRRLVGLKATPQELAVLDRAAALDKRTRTHFVLHYTTLVAQQIIAGKRVVFAE